MSSQPRKRAAAAAAPLAGILLVLSLTGCSAITDALQGVATHGFADRDELLEQWEKEAPWLPADASSIVTRDSTEGKPASLTAVSEADLDPKVCAEVQRQSAPTLVLEDTPDVYKADRVFACGDWAVIATDEGWYGWTPNSADEKEQSPAS